VRDIFDAHHWTMKSSRLIQTTWSALQKQPFRFGLANPINSYWSQCTACCLPNFIQSDSHFI